MSRRKDMDKRFMILVIRLLKTILYLVAFPESKGQASDNLLVLFSDAEAFIQGKGEGK
jgi:hypothetical protein